VVVKNPAASDKLYAYTLTKVNSSAPNIKFSKKIDSIVVSIASQRNNGDASTTFTFNVEKESTVSQAAQNVRLYSLKGTSSTWSQL
jgi:hypothetical protein